MTFDSCAALEKSTDLSDAPVLEALCPDATLRPPMLRALLLATRSRPEAEFRSRSLEHDPEAASLLRLAAGLEDQEPCDSVRPELPDPLGVRLVPVRHEVLCTVQQARRILFDRTRPSTDNTDAQVILARVYLEALAQLGCDASAPVAPACRLLMGPALQHARELCESQDRAPDPRFASLVQDLEVELLRRVRALDESPAGTDDALLTLERTRVARYLRSPPRRDRIERRLVARGLPREPEARPDPTPAAQALRLEPIAEAALRHLTAATRLRGFSRRYALARALTTISAHPEAARWVLERATREGSADLRDFAPLLEPLAARSPFPAGLLAALAKEPGPLPSPALVRSPGRSPRATARPVARRR